MPEFIYTQYGQLQHLTYLSAFPSTLILIGAGYGCCRLFIDVLNLLRGHSRK